MIYLSYIHKLSQNSINVAKQVKSQSCDTTFNDDKVCGCMCEDKWKSIANNNFKNPHSHCTITHT